MTGELFENWLKALDLKITQQKFQIVLCINNCKVRPSAIMLQLKSANVKFTLPNTISKLQPLDQRIKYNFNIKYRHEVIKNCIGKIEEGMKLVNILQAMQIANKHWNCVEEKTIANVLKGRLPKES